MSLLGVLFLVLVWAAAVVMLLTTLQREHRSGRRLGATMAASPLWMRFALLGVLLVASFWGPISSFIGIGNRGAALATWVGIAVLPVVYMVCLVLGGRRLRKQSA